MQIPDHLQLLLARFNGRLVIPFAEALDAISYNQQTARNERSRKVFPIPVETRGSRLFISIRSLAEYQEKQAQTAKPLKKRGRPQKVSAVSAGGVKNDFAANT